MILDLRPVYRIAMVAMAGSLFGQTQVDLRTQSKTVDFSGAASTRPLKMGTVLPSVCTTGELFFSTAVLPGNNLYVCGASNAWSHSLSEAIPATTVGNLPGACNFGDYYTVTNASFANGGWPIYSCSPANTWNQFGVQADGTGYLTLSCTAPGSCLVGPNTAVLPSLPGANVWTGANDLSGASKTAMFRLASSPPATCDALAHEAYFNTTSSTLSFCASTNTWTNIAPQHSFVLYKNTGVAALAANGSTQTRDSFVIPGGTLQVGDVVEIEANFTRTGSAGGITFGVGFGTSSVCCIATPTASTTAIYKPTLIVSGTSQQIWGGVISNNNGSTYTVAGASSASTASIASPITVSVTQNGTGPDTGAVTSWFIKVTR